mmetsp:Transcript_15833/g.26482  ORF Transcript_15833/g.26482 Transcript_15833/m.26482 type:complete len:296 (+) Transcript_15833:147-1034(+)
MFADMTKEEKQYLALCTCAVCVCLALFVSFIARETSSSSPHNHKTPKFTSSSSEVESPGSPKEDYDKVKVAAAAHAAARTRRPENLIAMKGQKCAAEGKIEEALDYLTEAIALNSMDFPSIVCRSTVYFEKFNILESKDANANLTSHILLLALQDADTAISMCPDQEGGYLSKINILRSISEITEAKELCVEGLRRVPQSTALAAAAAAMQGETDYDEAAEFRKILEAGFGHSNNHSHDHEHSHDHPSDCSCPQHRLSGTPDHVTESFSQSTGIGRTKGKGKAKAKGKKKNNKKK